MKFNRTALLLAAGLTVIITACNGGKSKPPKVSNIEVSLQVTRWDDQLFQLTDKKDIKKFLVENPLFAKQFLHTDQYPHDSLAVNYLYNFLANPASKVMQKEIQHAFGDLSALQNEFEDAFRYLKYYYPEAKVPKVYTAVTGFAGNDLLVSDSAVVVGLDYYIGDSASYRPLEFPNYILKRYRPEYIVPSTVLLLSGTYNKSSFEDKTMLADMIYFGKAYYFSRNILPTTPDSLLIGYSGEDLDNASKNQDLIWAHFVEQALLYENSHFIKKKYMDERPKTLEIGDACPGRIGEWLGWEIVEKYMDQQPVSLEELMQEKDVQKIFMQSKYKPQSL